MCLILKTHLREIYSEKNIETLPVVEIHPDAETHPEDEIDIHSVVSFISMRNTSDIMCIPTRDASRH